MSIGLAIMFIGFAYIIGCKTNKRDTTEEDLKWESEYYEKNKDCEGYIDYLSNEYQKRRDGNGKN